MREYIRLENDNDLSLALQMGYDIMKLDRKLVAYKEVRKTSFIKKILRTVGL